MKFLQNEKRFYELEIIFIVRDDSDWNEESSIFQRYEVFFLFKVFAKKIN